MIGICEGNDDGVIDCMLSDQLFAQLGCLERFKLRQRGAVCRGRQQRKV